MLLVLLACTSPIATPIPVPVDPPPPVVSGPMRRAVDHVRGLPSPSEPRYAASHILIAWKGAVDAPAGLTRTEAQAFDLATELARRAGTEDFAELARQHSDGPSGRRGGSLGTYRVGTMFPDFEKAVAATAIGAIGPVVTTPFGWHVVRRDAIEEVRVRHLQVSWAGARDSRATRSKDEARTQIEALAAEATADRFAALATEHSDDAGSAAAGGDLGAIPRGTMMPAFEQAAFALDPGAVSGVVETPYGFHLIFREPAGSPSEPTRP